MSYVYYIYVLNLKLGIQIMNEVLYKKKITVET